MATVSDRNGVRPGAGGSSTPAGTADRLLSQYQRQKALGDTMKSLAEGDPRGIISKAAMGETSGDVGGYLLPYELQLGIDSHLQEYSLFHRHAWRQPMKTYTCQIPSFDLTSGNASGVTPLLGGFTLSYDQENTAEAESEPTFAGGQLVSRYIAAYCVVSNQLVADGGIALGAYLEQGFARVIAFAVERQCFVGTGVGTIMGVINSPATVSVARAGGSDISTTDMGNMMKALFPASYANSWWACNPSCMTKIAALASYQASSYFDTGSSILMGYLYGRPLMVTEKLPALGTAGDIVLFDPTMYALGTRSISIDYSKEVPSLWTNYQSVYRVVWRGDGQPMPKGTFTLADGATTSGCFVRLAA